jgi:hypothetical protein
LLLFWHGILAQPPIVHHWQVQLRFCRMPRLLAPFRLTHDQQQYPGRSNAQMVHDLAGQELLDRRSQHGPSVSTAVKGRCPPALELQLVGIKFANRNGLAVAVPYPSPIPYRQLLVYRVPMMLSAYGVANDSAKFIPDIHCTKSSNSVCCSVMCNRCATSFEYNTNRRVAIQVSSTSTKCLLNTGHLVLLLLP